MMKILSFLLLAIATFSCNPPETDINSDLCMDDMIQLFDMDHYTGVIEGECRNYLLWFTYDRSDYFRLENPCADMILHLWDCEKVNVCADNSEECQTIISSMTDHGVAGRAKL